MCLVSYMFLLCFFDEGFDVENNFFEICDDECICLDSVNILLYDIL